MTNIHIYMSVSMTIIMRLQLYDNNYMSIIMVVATTIAVTTTVIMTMTATTTMIMTMAAAKAMIMAMAATTTMTKNLTTTMAKNINTNMTTIFKQVQKDNFYCLLSMIKKVTKIQFALLL